METEGVWLFNNGQEMEWMEPFKWESDSNDDSDGLVLSTGPDLRLPGAWLDAALSYAGWYICERDG